MISRAELKRQAKEQLKGNIGTFFLAMLAYMAVPIALSLIFAFVFRPMGIDNPLLEMVLTYAVCAPLMVGFYKVYLIRTYGEKPQVSNVFDGYRECYGTSVWLYILTTIYIVLWSLLFVIPGIIKSFSYFMSWYILAENPDMNANEVLTKSKRIMKGHKFELFVLTLSFLPWMLLGVLTLGLAYIYVLPYMYLTITNFYHNIKD